MVLENHRPRFCFLVQKLGSANTGWRGSATEVQVVSHAKTIRIAGFLQKL